jgi:murein DD-endopeptidase MepM/ murein hydrolase activator NlpD
VVIVEHPDGRYSMYGHLDHAVPVAQGDAVRGRQQIGTVFRRTDGNAPSHLHFECRDFLFNDRVNGAAPENGVHCGVQCAPGPGYWPQRSPEHPVALGWRNPAHVVGSLWRETARARGLVAEAAPQASRRIALRSSPLLANRTDPIAEIEVDPGQRFSLIDVWTGDPESDGTSAEAYALWFRIAVDEGLAGWAPALQPTAAETGSDGRPSALRFDLLPVL